MPCPRHFLIENVIPDFTLGISESVNLKGYFLFGYNIFAI
jgi:hypothetical protein